MRYVEESILETGINFFMRNEEDPSFLNEPDSIIPSEQNHWDSGDEVTVWIEPPVKPNHYFFPTGFGYEYF